MELRRRSPSLDVRSSGVDIFYGDGAMSHGAGLGHDLVDVRPMLWILTQHRTYEFFDPIGEGRVGRVGEGGVQDGHLAELFKGRGVVAQLVEQDAQGPDVAFLVNGLLTVDVYHFRATVLQGRMALHIILDETALGGRGGGGPRGRRGAKVAELVRGVAVDGCDEYILDLEIAVQERWLQVVHGGDALGHVGEDVQDLGLGQAVLQACVHQVDEAAARAELHEQKDLVAAALELRGVRVEVGDNLGVAVELLHRLDLGTHVGEGVLVGAGHALEHGRSRQARRLNRLGDAHQVDVGETALGQVLFDGNAVRADLHLGARGEGARGRVGAGLSHEDRLDVAHQGWEIGRAHV